MTADIRAAAQRERVIKPFKDNDVWRDENGEIWVSQQQHNEMVLKAHAWGADRVTPTREQLIDVLRKHQHDYCEECHMSHGCTCGWRHKEGSLSTDDYDGEDPVGSISEHQTEVLLALMAGLAEGESSGSR